MPTYEYRCSDCGTLFEVFQRIEDDPLTVCERCGGKLRKVFHPAGIVFKGSGFYATDSRGKAKAGSNESADGKAEKSEKTSSSDKGSSSEKKEGMSSDKTDKKKPAGSESGS
jgi:putative FmdB family regulatory protein